jgi:hypothetical protein
MDEFVYDDYDIEDSPLFSALFGTLYTPHNTHSHPAPEIETGWQTSEFEYDDGGVSSSALVSAANLTPSNYHAALGNPTPSGPTDTMGMQDYDYETDYDATDDDNLSNDIDYIVQTEYIPYILERTRTSISHPLAGIPRQDASDARNPDFEPALARLGEQRADRRAPSHPQKGPALVLRGCFLDLPAELRLLVYGYASQDTNPITRHAGIVAALPRRLPYTYNPEAFWGSMAKPSIGLAPLMRTCWQVYREARDEFLYRDRRFAAYPSRLDHALRDAAPSMAFWAHIQRLSLLVKHASTLKTLEVRRGIECLTSALNGGKKLRSLELVADLGRHDDILLFGGLRVQGPITITQRFTDDTQGAGEAQVEEREARLQKVMLQMRGLPGTLSRFRAGQI